MNDCVFCKIAKGEISSFKIYEDEHTFAFLDINPVAEFHTLVIPKIHYENMFDVPEEQVGYIMRTVKKIINILKNELGVTSLHVINNSGKEAQQDVFHLHYHIIPRNAGDGQNIKWKRYPGTKEKFKELLDKLE